jgi:23S rRNA pseudouridine1911/1915/1917 synthase
MIEVLFEDNHLLAVNKPAMLPTMGVAEDRPSLLREAKAYLKKKYDKPGNVYLGIVSRLDAPVTGIVLMARTSKAAARLTLQFRERSVAKKYWAVVEGYVDPPAGHWSDWLRKDERHRRVHVCRPGNPDGKEALLNYQTLQRLGRLSLLELELLTCRKHQLRVQLAHRDYPILGDRKYGSRRDFPNGIALHARQLRFEHPVRHEPVEIVAALPAAWEHLKIRGQGAGVGGQGEGVGGTKAHAEKKAGDRRL